MYASANRITTGSNNNGLSATQVNTISLLSLVEADSMTTSSNGNIFRVTGHLCGEFTGHRWIPRTKASDAELWYVLLSAPEYTTGALNREVGGLRRHRAHYDVTVMGWEFENMSSCYDGFVPSPAIVGHKSFGHNTRCTSTHIVHIPCENSALLGLDVMQSWHSTHWGRGKMAAILQTTFSDYFSWFLDFNVTLSEPMMA